MNTERYERQIILPAVGMEGQKKLSEARVLVIGAGGLASAVLPYLAGAGIGTIGIADGDTVSLTNLHRQIIHSAANIGKNKAESAKEMLQRLNDEITVRTYPVFVKRKNLEALLESYDFVVDAVDDYRTKFLINDVCVTAEKPFCHAGVVAMHGQVLTWVPGKGPCLRCIFEDMPEPGSVPTCRDIGVLGPVVGIIGSIEALETIRYFLGDQELLTGKIFSFDAERMQGRIAHFPNASPACPVCGARNAIRSAAQT